MPKKRKQSKPPEMTRLFYSGGTWKGIRRGLVDAYDSAADHKKRPLGALINVIDAAGACNQYFSDVEMTVKQRALIYRHISGLPNSDRVRELAEQQEAETE